MVPTRRMRGTRINPGGTPTLRQAGQTLGPLVGNKIRGLQPVLKRRLQCNMNNKHGNEDGDESGSCKRSRLMRMVQRLRKKRLEITLCAEF